MMAQETESGSPFAFDDDDDDDDGPLDPQFNADGTYRPSLDTRRRTAESSATIGNGDGAQSAIEIAAKFLHRPVVRGRDWDYDDQDGGIGGFGTVVRVFLSDPMRSSSIRHEFGRPYPLGTMMDGGGARIDTVLVQWDAEPGRLYNYRSGYDGKLDLRLARRLPQRKVDGDDDETERSKGNVAMASTKKKKDFRHLNKTDSPSSSQKFQSSLRTAETFVDQFDHISNMGYLHGDFRAGEAVRVVNDSKLFQHAQRLLPTWNPKARDMGSKAGIVMHSSDDGTAIRVAFGCDMIYEYPPRLLTKLFQRNDTVRIVTNRSALPTGANVYDRLYGRKLKVIDILANGYCAVVDYGDQPSQPTAIHANLLLLARPYEEGDGGSTSTNPSRSTAVLERKKKERSMVAAREDPTVDTGPSSTSTAEPGIVHDLVNLATTTTSSGGASPVGGSEEEEDYDDIGICDGELDESTESNGDSGEPNGTLFISLVNRGDTHRVMAMLERWPTLVHGKWDRGKTALHVAIMKGHTELIGPLLQFDSDVTATDDDGDNALHFAVHKDRAEMLPQLIGSNPIILNAPNGLMLTPLHLAVRKRCRASIRVLLTFPELVLLTVDDERDTPLHDVVKLKDEETLALLLNDERIMQLLNVRNGQDFAPCQLAVGMGANNMIQQFIRMYPGQTRDTLKDPLHIAASKNDVDTLGVLLEEGSYNPDALNERGCTPLHVASFKSHAHIVGKLLENTFQAANVSIHETNNGKTALHLAAESLRRSWTEVEERDWTPPCTESQLYQMFAIESSDVMATYLAISGNNQLAILCYLLRHGADPFDTDQRDSTMYDCLGEELARKLRPILDYFASLTLTMPSDTTDDEMMAQASASASNHDGGSTVQCFYCEENEANVMTLPCRHRSVCLLCFYSTQAFKRCPKCRVAVESNVGTDGEPLTPDHSQEGAGVNPLLEHLRSENERLNERLTCQLCYDRPKEVAPVCGHAICRQCAFEPRAPFEMLVARSPRCSFCRRDHNNRFMEFNK